MASAQVKYGAGERKSGSWKPAIRMGLALIAVLVVLLIFETFMVVAFVLMRNEGWIFRDMFGEYPIYDALHDIARGILLLIIAGFFVGGNTWKDALFDRLQLAPDNRKAKLLINGLILGLVASAGVNLILSLMEMFLFGGQFIVWLEEYQLIITLLGVIPRLILYVGIIALLQGYFQRRLTDHYGAVAGLLGATLIYLLLTIFPANIRLLAIPDISVQYVLIGAAIAFLYMVSRSLYLPVGFMVALYSLWDIYNSVFHVIPAFLEGDFLGVSHIYWVAWTMIAVNALILAMLWLLYRSPGEKTDYILKGLDNALKHFLSKL